MVRVGIAGAGQRLDGPHRAVDRHQVEDAVAVGVDEAGAEAVGLEGRHPEAGGHGDVLEEAGAVVLVEGVGLAREVGHEEVEVAVAVVVARVDAHRRLGEAVGIQRAAGEQGLVAEGAVALVEPQLVGRAVVGHVEVDPAVAVEVGGHRAQGLAVDGGQARGRRHVVEGAVAPVPVEAVGHRPVDVGMAVVGSARGGGAGAVTVE